MQEILLAMRTTIQEALDDLGSPRSSSNAKTRALQSLERQLVSSCTSNEESGAMHSLIALQHTFECNIPSRLLSWISSATMKLDQLTNKGTVEQEQEQETYKLASQLSSSLSLIQGVALIHHPSKVFLGHKYALEILLDLLLVSRHLSNSPDPSSISSSKNTASATALPLSSIVLDTLLCILVDSSEALRSFEDANGVQAVVKILKRAGTPREVRMKCLEFLYFYLLDETPSAEESHELPKISQSIESSQSTPPPSRLSPPFRMAKPSVNETPARPSRYGSGSSNYFPSPVPSSGSTRSTRSASGSSTSSAASSSTAASSVTSSPDKSQRSPHTPPSSPPPPPHRPPPLQPRSMMMLRKEVDYIPLSPKKPSISNIPSRRTLSSLGSRSRLGSSSDSITDDSAPSEAAEKENMDVKPRVMRDKESKRRTTDEKKELLGTMLGNVDALVEGVRKAGIWGLG